MRDWRDREDKFAAPGSRRTSCRRSRPARASFLSLPWPAPRRYPCRPARLRGKSGPAPALRSPELRPAPGGNPTSRHSAARRRQRQLQRSTWMGRASASIIRLAQNHWKRLPFAHAARSFLVTGSLLGQGIAERETAQLYQRLVCRRPDAERFHPGDGGIARGLYLSHRFAALRQVERHLERVLPSDPADQILSRRQLEVTHFQRHLGDEVVGVLAVGGVARSNQHHARDGV